LLHDGVSVYKSLKVLQMQTHNITQQIVDQDGSAYLIEDFIEPGLAADILQQLLDEITWQQEHYVIYGKSVAAPRLVAWYGDPQARYTYSGIAHEPLPWLPVLLDLKKQVERVCQHQFNSVLCNLYRHGQDSMGWHADKEPELGRNPYIASLSFGDARLFKFRHLKTKETVDVVLHSGSLLLMGGELQHHWRHSLPKSAKSKLPRINLTFRKIVVSDQ
jgi:alkylated DNA repair dioxygenase AlkB